VNLRTPIRCAAAGALLLVSLAGCGMNDRFVAIGSVSAAKPASGAKRLEVRGCAGSITIAPSSGDEVSVTAAVSVRESRLQEFPTAEAARDLKFEVDGEVVKVADAHAHDGRSDFTIDFTISAPARLAWRLDLGAGRIDATGGGSAIDLESGAGEVRIGGAVATLHATSGAGSVTADVESIAGGLLHSGAGSVRLSIAGGALKEKLACTSGAGEVTISLPAGFSADASLKSGAGRVVVDGASLGTTSHVVGGSASGRLGAGGPQLVGETGAGSVTLRVRP
jgi:hypothetical protein